MAANDPTARRKAASVAARARLAGLDADQRRDMTGPAREALRRRDLAAVDDAARRAGEHPLQPEIRQQRADELARGRALHASQAASEARTRRKALAETLRAEGRAVVDTLRTLDEARQRRTA
jgi:hypothetical protein